MPVCPVCNGPEKREELVDEAFQFDGRYVLVGGTPAVVCVRCGEQGFSRETVEKVRTLAHGESKASKNASMQVFGFVS